MSDEPDTSRPEYLIVAERITATCARLERKREHLDADMASLFGRMEANFDRIEGKLVSGFDRLESRLDSKFGTTERKLARVEYAFAACAMLFFVLIAKGFHWI